MSRVFAIPILFFLSFLFAIWGLLPKYTDFKNLKEEVAKKELSFQQKQKYYLNLQNISAELESYQDALEKIDSALPQEFSEASLLNFFQAEAAENGLVVKTLGAVATPSQREKKEKTPKTPSKIKEHYFTLTVKGSINSFKAFLKGLEKSSRLIEIENISLQVSERELPELVLLVKVYSY
jgi:Tfp pilus assembly protein PilO